MYMLYVDQGTSVILKEYSIVLHAVRTVKSDECQLLLRYSMRESLGMR